MKTYNFLFSKIIDYENLYRAFLCARKGKRYRKDVLDFKANLEENLINIQNHLLWKSYTPSRYKEFYVYDPKKRLICAPAFVDRVVHHALVRVIEPLFEKKFIFHSYACRIEKGNHKAMKMVQKYLRRARRKSNKIFVLKADISKYFPSIDHKILKQIIRKTIKCKNTLYLIDTIIDSSGQDDGIGLPIGALTSQLFANVYLNEFDHFVKDELGVKFYVRYMDDFIIIDNDRDRLKFVLGEIKNFLEYRLRLKLNKKTHIFPAKQGIDFCGYRIWTTHILPRKRNIKKARRMFKALAKKYKMFKINLEYIKRRLNSFRGYVKHCNAYITTKEILNEFKLQRY